MTRLWRILIGALTGVIIPVLFLVGFASQAAFLHPADVAAAPPWDQAAVASESLSFVSSVPSSLLDSGTLTETNNSSFDGNSAYGFALEQCAIGPRATGTAAGRSAGDHIAAQLKASGWEVSEQEFTYRGVAGRNIIAVRGAGPAVLLGAHYDTRPVADRDPNDTKQPVPGGNDGASGVAVLLELARVLDASTLDRQVWLAFFDAEDRGELDGWPFSVGAEHMASHLTVRPDYMVLVDMVGDRDQNIYWESNSDPALMRDLWSIAEKLGYGRQFIPEKRWGLMDDHIPFVNRGIPSVDIIDFDYPYWHTALDTCDKISPESLERVGRVLQSWLAQISGQ